MKIKNTVLYIIQNKKRKLFYRLTFEYDYPHRLGKSSRYGIVNLIIYVKEE